MRLDSLRIASRTIFLFALFVNIPLLAIYAKINPELGMQIWNDKTLPLIFIGIAFTAGVIHVAAAGSIARAKRKNAQSLTDMMK